MSTNAVLIGAILTQTSTICYNFSVKKMFFVVFLLAVLIFPKIVWAQANTRLEYALAKVTNILDAGEESGRPYQTAEIKLLNGSEKGQTKKISVGGFIAITENQTVSLGEFLIVTQEEGNYYLVDKFRAPYLGIIFAIFFLVVFVFGKLKGLSSILGLFVSLLILIYYMIPRIVAGDNPILISLIGAFVIAFVSIYLAHGFSKRTTIALVSTLITLIIATLASFIFVGLAKLSGAGTEEALFLQSGLLSGVNLKGLLLGGIIIGSLGVLDDITTAQVATVDELKKANKKLDIVELYKRGLSVGREHIASLVNTLVLAYAGASFPLLLLFTLNQDIPFWVSINSEYLAEEVVRTLVGSTSLILAVPISTFLAAYLLGGKLKNKGQ